MREYLQLIEQAGVIEGLSVIASGMLGLAYSQKQKNWIKDRDNNECVAPWTHPCNEDNFPLEVHHILGQRYLAFLAKMRNALVSPDFPENGITLCREAHDEVHPDRVWARRMYHQFKDQGKNSFAILGQQREEKLKRKEVTWNPTHDRQMSALAVINTQIFEALGKVFPGKKGD